MADKGRMEMVLRGAMDDLPPVNSQMVRIFTSSTFTDTYEERNILMKEVYPKLRSYCRQKFGLEFQVVDMRWGVRDEHTDDHLTSALCLEEIRNCQRLSVGPNFVTFLGQRYGSRPFSATIDCQEFEGLLKALEQCGRDKTTLSEWYLRDDNSIPPVYVLQAISSKLPGFISKDDKKRQQAREEWNRIAIDLKSVLRDASIQAIKMGLIDTTAQKKYLISVTEDEINCGLQQPSGNPSQHCLCFVRIIEDIADHLDHHLAWRFIDVKSEGDIDTEAKEMLSQLREQKVIAALNRLNVFRSSISWDNVTGVNQKTHAKYLKEMANKFYDSISFMVEKAIMDERVLRENPLYMEVIQHLHMARERVDLFHGRQKLLEKVKARLTAEEGPSGRQVVVLNGPSGCGKTSIMAVVAHRIRQWIPNGDKAVVILRFLGTTPQSTRIDNNLISVCDQIGRYYHKKDFKPEADLSAITNQFKEMIKSGTKSKPLVLVLDSLDQLSSANYAHKLGWLPRQIPKNCYFVVSTLPEHFGILDIVSSRIDDDNLIEISLLGENLSQEIICAWLDSKHRTLSNAQNQVVQDAFKQCTLPLYVKLVYEQVLEWKSYYPADKTILSHTVRSVINDLFERVEKKHGSLLVCRTLGYLTASKSGLTESELEDLLSLDDEVLTYVFQYHVPPTRRLPPSLLVRIKHDIASYLVTREADMSRVVYWYHRQFIEAARERYVKSCPILHTNMADYFMGIWHNKEKPFEYTNAQMSKFKLDSSAGKADRLVAAQPLIYSEEGPIQYNLRKMNNLPYHLANSKNAFTLFKDTCLFNYDWLYSKLKATSVQAVLDDLYMVLEDDIECNLLRHVLSLSRSTLKDHLDTLPVEIIGRLKPYAVMYHPFITKLVDECYRHGAEHNALLPRQQCYLATGGCMKYVLEHHDHPPTVKSVVLSSDDTSLYVLSVNGSLLMWDLEQGEIERDIQIWPRDDPIRFNVIGTNENRTKIVIGAAFHTDKNPIIVLDSVRGEVTDTVCLEKVYKNVGFVDSFRLYVLDEDNLLVVVDRKAVDRFQLSKGKLVYSFEILPTVSLVSLKNQRAVFGQKDSTKIAICDLELNCVLTNVDVEGTPEYIAMNAGVSSLFISKSKQTTISCIDIESKTAKLGDTIEIPALKFQVIKGISLSPMNTYLIIKAQTSVLLWDVGKCRIKHQLDMPSHVVPGRQKVPVFSVQMTTNEHQLVVAYNQHLLVWNVVTGTVIRIVDTFRKLDDLLLNFNSDIAITTFLRNRMISVWDLHNLEEETHTPLSLESGCRYMALASKATSMVVRGYNSTECRVVSLSQGCILQKPEEDIETMAPSISADGSVFAMHDPGVHQELGPNQTSMIACNSSSGFILARIGVSSLYLKNYTLSQNGNIIITHSESSPKEDVHLVTWNTQGGTLLKEIPVEKGGIGYMFTADDDTLLVAQHQYPLIDDGRQCSIAVYELETTLQLYTIHHVLKDSLHVTPGSKTIVYIKTGDDPSKDMMIVQDIRSQKVLKEIENIPVGRLHFCSNASRAVDTEIKLFDLQTGNILSQFTDPIEKLITKNRQCWPKISSDGQHVVYLVLRKAMVQVGHVDSGQLVGKCFVHAMPLSLELSSNNIVAIGADDGRIMLMEIVDIQHVKEKDKTQLMSSLGNLVTFKPIPSRIGDYPISRGNLNLRQAISYQSSTCCSLL